MPHANPFLQRLPLIIFTSLSKIEYLCCSVIPKFQGKKECKALLFKKNVYNCLNFIEMENPKQDSLPMFPIPIICTKGLCGDWICDISFLEALYRKVEMLIQLLPQFYLCFVRI